LTIKQILNFALLTMDFSEFAHFVVLQFLRWRGKRGRRKR